MSDSPAGQPAPKNAPHTITLLQHNALKGFLLAAAGLFLFACMDSTTKYLTTHYNVPFVVAMRYIVHFLLMVMILAPRHSAQLVYTQRTGLVVARAVVLTIASLCMGMALHRMPLAETTAINFLAPTLVALLAGSMLGEKIGGWGWAAIVTGFIGVLLIARPGGGLDAVGIMFALGAAAANATYQLLSRLLASTEKAIALLFYTALLGSIIFGIALPWFWENEAPSELEVILLLSMGVSGGLGHYLFTLAYRHAPASMLAPTTYLQLLWAGLLGWIIFDTIPDSMSLIGMAIVAASGLIIAFKSH
ncbi:DMT family transporter [Cellvibrio sp. UBA7671]|jgi:drug/metabolite transporter (DMT)-like permease|uniref:DMT family transporter n=1 Tax=Cellvibrio sp. UBA7671 TaxID=1946312 RepID=UPI002F351C2D